MALLDWLNADTFATLRDKVNAIVAAVNPFAGGTANQIWTKDSGTDFDGSWKNSIAAVLIGITLTGKARYILRLNAAEDAIELYSPISSFVSNAITGTSYITISTSVYTTLNDGAGNSLLYVLPNDNVTRKLFISAIAAFENGAAQTSIIWTRISLNNVAQITSYTDLRADQDDVAINYFAEILCTGQTIRVDSKLNNPAVENGFGYNGGSLTVIEIA